MPNEISEELVAKVIASIRAQPGSGPKAEVFSLREVRDGVLAALEAVGSDVERAETRPEPRPVPVHSSGPGGAKPALPIRHLKQTTDCDCIRTCIAMLLGFDSPEVVPCFYEDGDGKAWERAQNWLLHAGYALVSIPMRPPTVQQAISRIKGNIGIPVILGANHDESNPASSHCIVVTPERVHDPAYGEPGVHCLSATHTNGEIWVMAIVPFAWPHRAKKADYAPGESPPKPEVQKLVARLQTEALAMREMVLGRFQSQSCSEADTMDEAADMLTRLSAGPSEDDVERAALEVEKLATIYQAKLAERYLRERDEARAALTALRRKP